MSNIKTEKFRVLNLNCGVCASHTEQALRAVAGVRSAEVDFSRMEAEVTYDADETSPVKLREAVQKEGYDMVI